MAHGRANRPRQIWGHIRRHLAIHYRGDARAWRKWVLLGRRADFITGQGVARQVLEHLDLPTTGPPTAKAARMGDDEREPEYDQVDPAWEE